GVDQPARHAREQRPEVLAVGCGHERRLWSGRMHGRTPSSQETWDAFFSDFSLRIPAPSEGRGEAREQALAAAALSGCPDGGELLDVACGFGRHALPLAQAGFHVTGVDRSAALLDEARARGRG